MLMSTLLICRRAVVLLYSGSSPNGHSHKLTAPLMATFTKPGFSQLPYKICILLHICKLSAPVMDNFFMSQGCPLTRASTVTCMTRAVIKVAVCFSAFFNTSSLFDLLSLFLIGQ